MRIWTELLPTPPSTVDDDFFDLGGQSLHLVHFLQRTYEVYGIDLSVVELFADEFSAARTATAIDRAVVEEAEMRDLLDGLESLPAEAVDTLLAETRERPWPAS
jgi:hypothetical protein